MISEILEQMLQVGFFAAVIRIATPLLLATLGELFAERAGVLNLGIEGIMLLGAMVGFSDRLFHAAVSGSASPPRSLTGVRLRAADGAADREPRPQPARLRHRRDPALHRARLLFLPADLRPAVRAAQCHSRSRPLALPGLADMPCARPDRSSTSSPWSTSPCSLVPLAGLRALPHALGPQSADGRREPARGRLRRGQRRRRCATRR